MTRRSVIGLGARFDASLETGIGCRATASQSFQIEQSMPRVTFTANLQRHVECPPADASGATVHEVLESVFALNPRVKGYVLDEQGAVRHHVVIFVDGTSVRDRRALSDPVSSGSEIYVMQALSGG